MRSTFMVVGIALMVATSLAAADKPKAVVVVSDESWKGTHKEVKDWQNDKGSEEGWIAGTIGLGPDLLSANYGTENTFGFPTKARWIWAGPNEWCFLRRSVEVPKDFHRAEMLFAADDVAEIYVNGRLAAAYDTGLVTGWGARGCALLVDLVPFLQEGKNLIAVKMVNRAGPKGWATEIRIDGEPFVPRLEPAKALPREIEKEVKELTARLDDDDFKVREEATDKLAALIEKHGICFRDTVESLKQSKSAEVRTRAEVLWAALAKKVPELQSSTDPNQQIPSLTVDMLSQILGSDASKQVVAMRHLLPARKLLAENEKGVCDVLTKLLQDAPDSRAERVVAFISFLEIGSLDKSLVELIQKKPKTGAAAAAASALGKLGKSDHKKVLEEAAQCGYDPTERAAKYALRVLKEKE